MVHKNLKSILILEVNVGTKEKSNKFDIYIYIYIYMRGLSTHTKEFTVTNGSKT